MKKIIVIISIIVIGFFVFIQYGRSVYIPIMNKITGPETVESISNKIEIDVLARLKPYLEKINLDSLPSEMIIVGLKEEKRLEVYAYSGNKYKFLKSYPFTGYSGELGPKLKEGDKQIPEGIYQIEYLNPNSSYYLSMKISYPNEFDISKSKYDNVSKLGGDIMIHGKSHTIGCIPIGDPAVEELFILANYADNIKVILCPWDFRAKDEIPNIDGINWELELYRMIKKELKLLTK